MKKQLSASLMMSLAAAAFGTSTMTHAATQEIAVMAWGTTWEQGLQTVADTFEKQTGIHVVPVTQSGSADGYARLQSMQDAPKIDVWFSTSSLAARVTGPELPLVTTRFISFGIQHAPAARIDRLVRSVRCNPFVMARQSDGDMWHAFRRT